MKKNNFKIKYLLITICLILNSEVMFTSSILDIAKDLTTETETTRRKPRGSKVENAQFFDKMYEKNRIIITEGDGGNGSGGKTSGDSGKDRITSSGSTKNLQNGNNNIIGGTSKGNGSGQKSNKANKSLRDVIDESRRESIASELATAQDVEEALRRIEESESIYESIRKALIQESIKAEVFGERNKSSYKNPLVAPEEITTAPSKPEELKVPTPLNNHTNNFQFNNNRTKTNIAIEERNGNITPQSIVDISAPTADFITEKFENIFDDNLIPTALFQETVLQTKQNNGATIYETRENNQIVQNEVYEEYQNTSVSVEKINYEVVENSFYEKNIEEVAEDETDSEDSDEEMIDAIEIDDINGDTGIKSGENNNIDSVFDTDGKTTHIKIIEIDTNGGIGIKNKVGNRNITIYIGVFSLLFLFLLGFISYFNLSEKMIEYKSYF